MKIGIIGGSGLGELLPSRESTTRHDLDTPFGKPSDAIIETRWHDTPVFMLSRHGPGHLLNPSQVPYRANLFALKQLGVTHVLASGAVGSLRDEFRPRDLVIPDQVIDKTHRRVGTFYEQAAVHVDFAQPFCPVLRQVVLDAAAELRQEQGDSKPFSIHGRGCYVCMEGPAFSTRAESLMHRLWGGDLIGMTVMPEAKLAREAELSYAMVALVTDYDCWRVAEAGKSTDPNLVLNEVIANLRAAADHGMQLLRRAAQHVAQAQEALMAAPSRQALRLAIWSDRSRIDAEEKERLRVLWGEHVEASPQQ